ncbi:LysR family transcriptional regulator [Novispirillum itersonii]|uniref:LysR family transcriptional regulator of beta-lactamase n=1 Tax=Novispirillum itersonii TaxID=189 RepID=A0A7X0DKE1_NOVIT|nr:LysR family transcriptional regulator [Novispirillum itersonii]MBB6208860.1 LysR family transcriptional regulator of beta-lactamase [Novispirillum itersonii]
MEISQLPLNALRAFEASARLNSFTKAGLELCVSQTAISHQVRLLEDLLGVTLFTRLPRGVVLTDEGQTLLPVLSDAFRRMSTMLANFQNGSYRDILTVGVVGTLLNGWLLPRLPRFSAAHPGIDLRLKTNNNRADILADGLDYCLRFGDGAWHGTNAVPLLDAPLSPVCSPAAASRLQTPADLLREPLLRSYRADEWALWFTAAGLTAPPPRGWMFDSSVGMVAAVTQNAGVGLVPVRMFAHDIAAGRILQPFPQTVTTGRYWLTWLKSREENPVMQAFHHWLLEEIRAGDSATG